MSTWLCWWIENSFVRETYYNNNFLVLYWSWWLTLLVSSTTSIHDDLLYGRVTWYSKIINSHYVQWQNRCIFSLSYQFLPHNLYAVRFWYLKSKSEISNDQRIAPILLLHIVYRLIMPTKSSVENMHELKTHS